MAYPPAGYEDDYSSSDSDDYIVSGPSLKPQGNGMHTSTNGSMGGFGMATQAKLQRDQQGAPLVLDDFKTAASRGKLEAVQEFINRGMPVDSMLKAGWTALMYAASCGQAGIVKYLLEKGADPNFNKASFMYSPLMAVCSSNLPEASILECVTLLMDHGADINTHEKSHMTPLMFSALHGHASVVKKLLTCGAEVNREDNRRWTALFYAVEGGHTKVVELLLGSRANVNKVCSDGTAADIAFHKGHIKLAEMLEAAGNPAKALTVNGTTVAAAPSSPVITVEEKQEPSQSESTVTTTTTTATATPAPAPATTTTSNSITTSPSPLPPPPPPPSPPREAPAPVTTTTPAPVTPTTPPNQQNFHLLDDLELFLYGLNLGPSIPLFKNHAVTFAQVLQMNEDDLEKIGVTQVGNRKKIVDSIHAIHKKKWEPGSIRNPSSKILSQEESYSILDNVNKHIAYINSSVVYISKNLEQHGTLTDPQQEPGSLESLSKVGTDLLKNTRGLHQQLRELKIKINEASNCTDIVPADLITDPDERGMSRFKKTLFVLTAVGVAVSIAWYNKPLWIGYVKTS